MSSVSLLSRLAGTSRLTDVLPHLHQHALDTAGGSCSLLFELNARDGAWYATSGVGLDELGADPWVPEDAQRHLVDLTFRRRIPTLISDSGREIPDLVLRLGAPAMLLVPLAHADRRIGLLVIGFAGSPPPDAEWTSMLAVSDAFATALELSRLRQKEELNNDLQALLDEFSGMLTTTLDLSAALDVFCQGARRLFGADRASIWLHDRRVHDLALRASSDPPHVSRGVRISTEDMLAPAALGMRRTRADLAPTGGEVPTSTVTVPLRGRRRALGTVVFEGVHVETGRELDFLDRADELGRQLSGAIENIQLLESVIESRRETAPPQASGDTAGDMMTDAEREALRVRLTQSEKLAALGQFVAGIAHEMNNPLQSVLGHLELLRATGAFPKSVRREVQTIYREADRAAKIVRNLLVFAGSRRLALRPVSLHAVLQKVLALRASSCRALHIEVVRHYDPDLPRVQSDPLLLHQVFFNLLLNAEQAIAATARPGRIEITTSSAGGRVIATVRDSGNGIPAEVLSRVFEPFYTTKEVGKGTGLGLAITYGIIQEHGGQVSVANHSSGGAAFTIELPASRKRPSTTAGGDRA